MIEERYKKKKKILISATLKRSILCIVPETKKVVGNFKIETVDSLTNNKTVSLRSNAYVYTCDTLNEERI